MRQLKPALTIDEQIELLQSRHMEISDLQAARIFLLRTNYYRFSGYAFLFQKANDNYQKGTSFEHIVDLMTFDTQLRRILISSLEFVEIYARSVIAHTFSIAHGKNGGAHYDSSLFVHQDFHQEYLETLQQLITQNSSQPFVSHHIQSFNGRMPIWCAVELLSFSTLSKLYSNMQEQDKDLIAAQMNTDTSHLTNWLHCFSVLRNACAHYGRLYSIIYSPKVSLDGAFLRANPDVKQDTLFAYIIALLRLLPEADQKSFLIEQISNLIEQYSVIISLHAIGFPDNWKEVLSTSKNITLKPVSSFRKTID